MKYFLLMLLLTGCVAPQHAPTSQRTASKYEQTWPFLTAIWDHSRDWPCEYWIYHGTNENRNEWVKIGTTTNNSYTFQSYQYGFIGVRAYKNGMLSGWNQRNNNATQSN